MVKLSFFPITNTKPCKIRILNPIKMFFNLKILHVYTSF